MKRFFLCAAGLLVIAACSSSPEDAAPIEIGGGDGAEPVATGPRDCFTVQSVSGFTIVDNDTVRIEVGSDAYELDAIGAMCANLGFANQIALEAGPTAGSICLGDGPLTGTIRTDQGDQCQIQDVRRIPALGAVATTPTTTP